MKSKGVTTQMKALDEYFLMVVFTSLLNRVRVFAIFMLMLIEKHSREGLSRKEGAMTMTRTYRRSTGK